MKQLNVTLEDNEFNEFEELKTKSELSWRNFVIFITEHIKESIKQGDLEFVRRENVQEKESKET